MNFNDILTIVVPTHNRKYLLYKCISSIRRIFKTEHIIVCDNSSYNYSQLELPNTIDIINFRHDEGNIYNVYKSLVSNVKTPYTLIVEDDDQLINAKLHYKICQFIKTNLPCVITFQGKAHDAVFMKFINPKIYSLPFIWNNEFQFGFGYYPTLSLYNSINTWFNYNQCHNFESTYDEAIALLTIYDVKRYYHINSIGLNIGIQNDNMSWGNLLYRLYSAAFYIDDIFNILHMDNLWAYKYKNIVLNDFNNITYDQLYYNNNFITLRNKIQKLINNNYSAKYIKHFLFKELSHVNF